MKLARLMIKAVILAEIKFIRNTNVKSTTIKQYGNKHKPVVQAYATDKNIVQTHKLTYTITYIRLRKTTKYTHTVTHTHSHSNAKHTHIHTRSRVRAHTHTHTHKHTHTHTHAHACTKHTFTNAQT